MITRINPFDECPILESEHFIFRLVEEKDSKDLLKCYSDSKSAKIFNCDNCNSNFVYRTEEAVLNLIKFWLVEYNNRGYIRFSIVDKNKKIVIGTIEIFSKKEVYENAGRVGVLRLDLVSNHESLDDIIEILNMIDLNFPYTFGIDSIITKAISEADIRIRALKLNGYNILHDKNITSYSDYYIKTW